MLFSSLSGCAPLIGTLRFKSLMVLCGFLVSLVSWWFRLLFLALLASWWFHLVFLARCRFLRTSYSPPRARRTYPATRGCSGRATLSTGGEGGWGRGCPSRRR